MGNAHNNMGIPYFLILIRRVTSMRSNRKKLYEVSQQLSKVARGIEKADLVIKKWYVSEYVFR